MIFKDDKSSDENKSVITDKVVNGNPAELVPLEIKSNPAAVKSTNLDTNCLPSNKDAKVCEIVVFAFFTIQNLFIERRRNDKK